MSDNPAKIGAYGINLLRAAVSTPSKKVPFIDELKTN
jgi:hypothetical protein